ncbi:hypothetical protein BC829DRAFT_420861 [Chytridium lagenaria]|nr:hypothetical protein BC829DRAFT_420861 [Chytridium lagenaria]
MQNAQQVTALKTRSSIHSNLFVWILESISIKALSETSMESPFLSVLELFLASDFRTFLVDFLFNILWIIADAAAFFNMFTHAKSNNQLSKDLSGEIFSDSSSPTFKRMKLSTDNDNSLPKRQESIPVGQQVKPLIKVTMMNSLERRKMKEKVYLQKAAKIFDIRQDASNVTEATSGNSIRDISNISKILQRSYTERTTTGSRHMKKVQNESPQPLRKYEKGLSKMSCDLRDPAFRRAGECAVNIRASRTSQAAEVVQILLGSSVVRSMAGAQHTYRKAIQTRSSTRSKPYLR